MSFKGYDIVEYPRQIECEICGKVFEVKDYDEYSGHECVCGQRFCSDECMAKH